MSSKIFFISAEPPATVNLPIFHMGTLLCYVVLRIFYLGSRIANGGVATKKTDDDGDGSVVVVMSQQDWKLVLYFCFCLLDLGMDKMSLKI